MSEYCEDCMNEETFESSWCCNCPHNNDTYCVYKCETCPVAALCDHNINKVATQPKEEKMGEKFWMVCGPFNNPKFRHPTRLSAEQEAERLAKLHPQDKFFVLEAVGRLRYVPISDPKAGDLVWIEIVGLKNLWKDQTEWVLAEITKYLPDHQRAEIVIHGTNLCMLYNISDLYKREVW